MRPQFIAPELCKLKKEVFDDEDWIFEEKFDGIRCIAVKKGKQVSLYSRNQKRLEFPEIQTALQKTKKDFVADGEIVAFEGKVTSFAKLQQRKDSKIKAYLYLFDLLVFDGEDLRKMPLIERKQQLKNQIAFGGPIRYTTHVKGKGRAFFKRAEKRKLEGIIGKNAHAPYTSRRTTQWLKFKCTHRQELVIGGYTDPKHSRIGFGALLVGYYARGKFQYAGKIGTGYTEKTLKSLKKRLEGIERKTCPFSKKPKEQSAHFVSPTLVCEVGFTEWTKDGKLRHPTFLGLRNDKPAKKVRREQ